MIGRVKDSGIGIREEDQKRIFKLFGKIKNSEDVNTSGIGLGLFICKRICDKFDG